MSIPEPLQYDQHYHIYSRGTNGETLFREQRNYGYFLNLDAKHIEPVAVTYAYCLLKNHFHFLLRIKSVDEQKAFLQANQTGSGSETGPVSKTVFNALNPSRQFNNLFIAYSKAINKTYRRTGALFESPFKRKIVDDDRYFTSLVVYIHRNPQKHGFVDDFRDWPYSSYKAILSDKPTRIDRQTVLDWFDGRAGFEGAHFMEIEESVIEPVLEDDWM